MGGVFFDLLVCVGLFSSKLKRTHLNRRDKNGVLQEEVQMTAKHLPTGRTKPHMDGRCPLLEACGMTYLQSQGFSPENGGESTPILCPQSLPQWDPELHSEATRRGEELHPQRELVCLHKDAVLKDIWAEHDSLELGGFPLKSVRRASCSLKLFPSDKF